MSEPVEKPLSEVVYTTVNDCARCGKNHVHLRFAKLKRQNGEWTHWATCSRTAEPIMMSVENPDRLVKVDPMVLQVWAN